MPKQNVAVELFYDGAWHDLVTDDDVLTAAPIVITRGQGSEGAALRPTQVTVRLANDDDTYRPSNPESPLYGKAGRNALMRVSVDGAVRGCVEASSWSCGQTADFRRYPRRGSAWTDVAGGGFLQRVNQWTQPLKSAFRQYNESLAHIVGYWPLEQDAGSKALYSPTPGTRQGIVQNVAFDSQYRPPSSAPLMDFGDDPSEVGGFFKSDTSTTTTGWQLSWAARYGTLVAGEQDIMDWKTSDGTSYGLYLNPTTGNMIIYSSKGGVSVLATSQSYAGWDWTQWTMFNVDAVYAAGTTSIWIDWASADNTHSGYMVPTFAGTPAKLVWWDASTFAGVPPGSTIGHVIGADVGSDSGVDLYDGNRRYAWTGYLGEVSSYRFARLCGQLNIPYSVSAGWAESAPMGPQPTVTFLEHVREIMATDDTVVFDYLFVLGLQLISLSDRYNQTPELELTVTDLPFLPEEVTDDLDPHNVVTISQRDGGEFTARDDTGPMGTQAVPAGIGEYLQTISVNVQNEATQLPGIAQWRLGRGTVDLPRFPRVTVNLAALDPAMIAAVETVNVDSVITITGFREYTVRLRVLGYVETIGTHSRTISFACAPDQQFQIGTYDGTARYDSGTSTVEDLVPTETIWDVTTQDRHDLWSSVDEPYDVIVGGEVCTVTTMPAPPSGSPPGPYGQQPTCTRFRNGIRKHHPADSPVHVAEPGRWGQ